MSINLSQIFVRYPDEKDAAALLASRQDRAPGAPSVLVARTGTPWLAVCSGDNTPAPDTARHLSRALEGTAVWFGLAGNALAYRMIRYDLGREAEKVLEPPEIFTADGASQMPAYRDVEAELYAKLRALGIPQEYVYLFMEEVGVSGGAPGKTDAAVVRNGNVELFVHRVPRRSVDAVRTLFDHHKEGEQTVYETIRLQGAFDNARAKQLLQTLDQMCKRRSLPPGWRIRFVLDPEVSPDFVMRLAAVHAAGKFSYELSHLEP
ncbi:MAG: hypothetical protein HY293_05390 [Planctomycetes bacterium]|nr:hypothetical protein [Planctomycetota bacterium]